MHDRAEGLESSNNQISPIPSGSSLEFKHADLNVEDIMTKEIVSVAPLEPMSSAIQKMSEHNISCIVVNEGGRAVGILTERDVLKGAATDYQAFIKGNVADRMSSPVISVPYNWSALAASALMESKGIKRLLVELGERPVGVVTQTNITEGLTSMCRFKDISELMTPDVVTVSATTTVTEAAQIMAARNISCVVLWHHRGAGGIVTERDILQRVIARGKDPAAIPVGEIMSFPVVVVPPTYSVMSASKKMNEMHIHRLLVGTTEKVEGIISQTDIISAVRRKLEEMQEARARHRSEINLLVDLATRKLLSIQDLAGRVSNAPETCDQDTLSADLRSMAAELKNNLESIRAMVQESL
jgi:CBS domain-containing protein